MEELARMTKNYSGAEIEGLVKSAASYAFERGVDVKNLDKAPDPKNLVVQWQVSITYHACPRCITSFSQCQQYTFILWEGLLYSRLPPPSIRPKIVFRFFFPFFCWVLLYVPRVSIVCVRIVSPLDTVGVCILLHHVLPPSPRTWPPPPPPPLTCHRRRRRHRCFRRGQDFQRALGEVQPKFGADNQELQTLYANGIVPYSQQFEDVRTTLGRLIEQTRLSERTPIMSVRQTGRLPTAEERSRVCASMRERVW